MSDTLDPTDNDWPLGSSEQMALNEEKRHFWHLAFLL